MARKWDGMGIPVVAMAGVAQEAWLTLVLFLGEDEDERIKREQTLDGICRRPALGTSKDAWQDASHRPERA